MKTRTLGIVSCFCSRSTLKLLFLKQIAHHQKSVFRIEAFHSLLEKSFPFFYSYTACNYFKMNGSIAGYIVHASCLLIGLPKNVAST